MTVVHEVDFATTESGITHHSLSKHSAVFVTAGEPRVIDAGDIYPVAADGTYHGLEETISPPPACKYVTVEDGSGLTAAEVLGTRIEPGLTVGKVEGVAAGTIEFGMRVDGFVPFSGTTSCEDVFPTSGFHDVGFGFAGQRAPLDGDGNFSYRERVSNWVNALSGRLTVMDGRDVLTGSFVQTFDESGASSTINFSLSCQLGVCVDRGLGVSAPGKHELRVEVDGGTQRGSVVGGDNVISCGGGSTACAATYAEGAAVRLAALPTAAGRFVAWLGCDRVTNQSCLVTMSAPRTVRARFAYDWAGQWEPPPDGLFDPARKAEIAGNGANAAKEGALGCALTALAIGTAGESSVLVAGSAGVATRWQALAQQAFEETVGNCAKGIVGTIGNGVLLRIDPPDPAWRSVALAARFPRDRVSRCTLPHGCRAIDRARRGLVAANARVLELQEALAVAANRYGNAVGAGDRPMQAVHQATMRVTSGLLADASATHNRHGAALARAIRAAGVRSITLRKDAVARVLRARRAGRGTPRAAVARLLRRHLVTNAREVTATLRATARKQRAAATELLHLLARPVRTTQMRGAAAAVTLGDLAALLDAVQRDLKVPRDAQDRYAAQLAAAMQCDAGTAMALRALAASARAPGGLRGEGGLLVAAAARGLAARGVTSDQACTGS